MRGEGMERMAKLARNIEYYIGKADLNLRYDDDHIDLARFVLAVMPVVKATIDWRANEREIEACITHRPVPTVLRQREWQMLDAMRAAADAFTATEAGGEK
jgi:hypothetical protein